MLSIIIPFHNEVQNLSLLYEELKVVVEKLAVKYEIVFIDDGSTDKSIEVLTPILKKNSHVTVKRYGLRQGKGYALQVGLKESSGDILVFMDADLQDDPTDLGLFLAKLEEGYDLVNGVRKERKDNVVIKAYSHFGNVFLHKFLRSPFTDINCGFKMMRRQILDEIPFYSNNFRFIPIAAFYKGYRVSEIVVHNRPRQFGKSKFGIGKAFIGFMDTLTAFFIYEFSERPLHFFGTIGSFFFFIGFVIALYLSFERLFYGVLLYRRPALQLSILFIVVGIQIIMTGFIGELMVYLNKKNKV